MPITADAFFIAQSFVKRLAQSNTGILDAVMVIDIGIACAFYI